MATSTNQLRDDFPACIVCERSCKYPSTLACGHMMCRGCLAKYKISQRDANEAKSNQCPKCRQKTEVANPGSSAQLDNIRIFKKKSDSKGKPTLMDTIGISAQSDKKTPVPAYDLKEEFDPKCTPILVDTIDISTDSDERTPCCTDVTVVDVDGIDTLVVVDNGNGCIKSFYTMKKQARHSSLKLNDAVLNVSRLYHNQVAVLYCSEEISIVQVTPDLVLMSKITTKKMYVGLAALNDSTLVGGCVRGPPSVDILDMTGRVVKSIKPGKKFIRHPGSLTTTNDGNILVSDGAADAVYCLTPDGDIVFKYHPSGARALEYARGITTSAAGDIVVVNWHKSTLVQLTSTGHFVRDLLKPSHGIYRPLGICLHKDKLYVTAYSILKVFCVSKQNLK